MKGERIRVLLVDDHAVVREGYRRLLEKQEGIKVVGEAQDAASAYQAYKETSPEVVVMDISLPGRGGIDALRHIRQWDANARVLVFTMHTNVTYALQAFQAGAKGYVTKSSPPELLVTAVREVAAGKLSICPETSAALAANRVGGEASAVETLSPREFEILRLLLEAKTTEEIAAAFNLSPKTVANYHYTIKSKLGVASDIELVHYAIRQGLMGT